jgi:hypothetical protein
MNQYKGKGKKSSNSSTTSSYGKGYFIPFHWLNNVDKEELSSYFIEILNDQTINFGYEKIEQYGIGRLRKKIVEWMLYVSKNLNFKNETVFRCIQLFDSYLSRSVEKISTITDLDSDIQLSAVVCLNLACKLEEINCNYIKFLNENLLDSKYTMKQLVAKEIEILRTLKFKLHSSNFYNFNNLFLQIAIQEISSFKNKTLNEFFAKNCIDKNYLLSQLINTNDIIAKNYVPLKQSVGPIPLISGYICFRATLLSVSYIFGCDLTFLWNCVNSEIEQITGRHPQVMEAYQKLNQTILDLFNYIIKTNKFFSQYSQVQPTAENNNSDSSMEEILQPLNLTGNEILVE